MESRRDIFIENVPPIEVMEIIIEYTVASPYQLFHPASQTSASWRIQTYFTLLKKAHKNRDHITQQKLLTLLYVHHELLFKSNCKTTLQNNIHYLKTYRCETDILPESRLIALALLVIIHPEEKKQYKQEFLLLSIPFQYKKLDMLKAIISTLAKYENITLLNLKNTTPKLYCCEREYSYTIYEALLVIYSWPTYHHEHILFSTIQGCFPHQNRINETYINFLHAELLRLPKNHVFWQDAIMINHFIYMLQHTLSHYSSSTAFTAIIETLTKRISNPEWIKDFLQSFRTLNQDSQLATQLDQSLAVIQLNDETMKINWLKENLHHDLRNYYANIHRPISEFLLHQLKTSTALEVAIQLLYDHFLICRDYEKQYEIVVKILSLIHNIKCEKFWIEWIEKIFNNLSEIEPYYKKDNTIDLMISTLKFLPTEKLINDFLLQYIDIWNKKENIITSKILIKLCSQLTSLDLIFSWLEVFSKKMDISNDTDLTCQTILLSKVAKQIDIKEKINHFLPILYKLINSHTETRVNNNQCYYLLTSAAELLLHLNNNETIIMDWWIFLTKKLSYVFSYGSETKNRQPLIYCLLSLLQIMDSKIQKEYIEKFNHLARKINYEHAVMPIISLIWEKNILGNELGEVILEQFIKEHFNESDQFFKDYIENYITNLAAERAAEKLNVLI